MVWCDVVCDGVCDGLCSFARVHVCCLVATFACSSVEPDDLGPLLHNLNFHDREERCDSVDVHVCVEHGREELCDLPDSISSCKEGGLGWGKQSEKRR